MARRGARRGCFPRALLTILILLLALTYAASRVVRVEYATVALRDLPAALDGTTVLFLCDFHVGGFDSPARAAQLVMKLQPLYPDVLVLGGDYASPDLIGALRAFVSGERLTDAARSDADAFFSMIRDFYAPLGKFGAAGECDGDYDLSAAMADGGVTLLRGNAVRIEKDGASLVLAGLDPRPGIEGAAAFAAPLVGGGDTVIAVSHDPSAFSACARTPGRDGAPWVDLMLSGHTHGGQFNPFGFSPFAGGARGDTVRAGWQSGNGALLLVSGGVGTAGAPLRLGAPAQVHLLTLRRAA